VPKTIPALPGIPPSSLPFNQVVEANGLVFIAGQVGSSKTDHGRRVEGDIRDEVRAMLESVGTLLRAVGLDFKDAVRCTVYLTDMDDFAAMNDVYREFFVEDRPVRATVGVARLASDFRAEIEVTAAR
jgi:2-iminobutanoate/2-iminopropanoate deaminase